MQRRLGRRLCEICKDSAVCASSTSSSCYNSLFWTLNIEHWTLNSEHISLLYDFLDWAFHISHLNLLHIWTFYTFEPFAHIATTLMFPNSSSSIVAPTLQLSKFSHWKLHCNSNSSEQFSTCSNFYCQQLRH